MASQVKRLNWGCGPVVVDDWENSDLVSWSADQQHTGDIAAGLPWADDFFDYAVSHHALQMIDWPSLVPTLAELRRVIKPEGTLRVSVPDLLGAFRAFEQGEVGWFPIDDRHERTIDGKLCMYLTQAGATRSVFTANWLGDLLASAGFTEIMVSPCDLTHSGYDEIVDLDTRPAESIFMEGLA